MFLALAVTGAAMAAGTLLGRAFPGIKNIVSPTLIAIILGCTLRSVFPMPARFHAGIAWGVKTVLRAGIVFMGIRLSLFSIFKIGAFAVGLVALCICAALSATMLFARRAGISDRLAALIAAGTGICGVSAILSVAPAIEAEQEEVSYAVAVITLIGLSATLVFPYLVEMVLHLSVVQAGYFIGTAVHDTSQVTATGLMYNQLWKHSTEGGITGLDIALTTKLVRNTFMVFVIPLITLWFRFTTGTVRKKTNLLSVLPLFVVGYLCMGLLRTAGDFFLPNSPSWLGFQNSLISVSGYLIMFAVACIGLGTDLGKLKIWGFKPLFAGLCASAVVSVLSYSILIVFH